MARYEVVNVRVVRRTTHGVYCRGEVRVFKRFRKPVLRAVCSSSFVSWRWTDTGERVGPELSLVLEVAINEWVAEGFEPAQGGEGE